MKTKIFYFSGTGNSLFIAKEINNALNNPGELVPVAKYIYESTLQTDAEMIGFVFPIYMGSVPWVVKDFIKKIKPQSSPYIFAVATYNSHTMNCMPVLSELLKSCSMSLSLGEVVIMPGNAKKNSLEETEKKLNASSQRIIDIAKKINCQIVEPQFISTRVANKAISYRKKPNGSFTKYKLLSSCNSCGICKRICPMVNIEFNNKKPTWGENCAACLACFHWCPQKAIKWGMPIIGNRPQYHHPNVTVKDISEQQPLTETK